MISRAISIRQPYVEQILRGIKLIEYRSQPSKVIVGSVEKLACTGVSGNYEAEYSTDTTSLKEWCVTEGYLGRSGLVISRNKITIRDSTQRKLGNQKKSRFYLSLCRV